VLAEVDDDAHGAVNVDSGQHLRESVGNSPRCAVTGHYPPKSRRSFTIPTPPPPKRHPYDQWAPDARALDLVGDKWTLLIVRDLTGGPRRFVELQRVLPGISTEQLRSRLNRMVADGLLTRQRYREVPPRVDYELTERARALLPVVGALARWGARWAWGPPRQGERVAVGAILRAATGLPIPAHLHGTIEMSVTGADGDGGGGFVATMEVDGGTLTYAEHPADNPEARITGPQAAWVDAFGPDADRHGLTIDGDRALAEGLLDALAATTGAAAAAA
jgi:DNA-binding HxlR family transcriptional regulator